MKWNHWALIVLAVWLLISPWILGYAELNLIVWNNLIIAVLAVIFTLWHLSKTNI